METFFALLAICAGNLPFTGEFPSQRPVTRSFGMFFGLNKRLSKQWWGWWLETPSHSLWRRRHVKQNITSKICNTMQISSYKLIRINSFPWFSDANHIGPCRPWQIFQIQVPLMNQMCRKINIFIFLQYRRINVRTWQFAWLSSACLAMSIIYVVRKVISVLRLGTVANQSIILRCQHESNGKGNR